jgi:MarR family transcriptional regulator, transcriptional regulator for hemolysin
MSGPCVDRVAAFVSMLTMEESDPEKIGQLIGETARAWRHRLDQRLRPIGLTQAKWRTIAHLARGHLTQCELAGRLGIEEPTLARLLARLESGGWVKRASAAHDRRCKTVHLERKSSSLLRRIEQAANELRNELLEKIPASDLRTCMRVLSEIRDRATTVSARRMNGSGTTKKRNGLQ